MLIFAILAIVAAGYVGLTLSETRLGNPPRKR